MAVDEGVRDAYLTALRGERERLRGEIDQLRVTIERAKLEDQAQAVLPAEQQTILRDAGLLDAEDVTILTARRQELTLQRQALIALINAVQGAV